MDEPLSTVVGEFLRKARERKGLSQAQLAEAMGLKQQSVSKWEAGDSTPGLLRMQELATHLDIELVDLLVAAGVDAEDIPLIKTPHHGSDIDVSASGDDLRALAEEDPVRFAEVMDMARYFLDRARERREGT